MTVMLAAERPAAPAVPVAQTVRQSAGALSLSTMTPAEVWGFCERLADTPLLPDQYRRQPASVLWAMEYGRALGLDVVTTITTIHVIKGKPSQSADLMLSRTRAAGHRVRIQQGDGSCTVSIWRADDPEFENRVTWTFDDAVTANLCEMRNNRPWSRSQKGEPQAWEKYPRAMLRARAISECVRMACPEVLHGAIYTPEELGAVIDQDGNPVAEVAPGLVRQQPQQDDQWQQATPARPAEPGPAEVPPTGVTAAAELASTTPAGRDYLAEAMAAPDAATVRKIWVDAKAEGARPEYLDQIAAVGKARAAAADAGQPADHEHRFEYADDGQFGHNGSFCVVDGCGVEQPADPAPANAQAAAAQAEERLRIAASRAHLTTVDNDFHQVYGLPIDQATAQQLDAFRARIEAAGGQQ